MGKINMGRVILGGIVAGIVADLLGYLVDGLWLGQRWADAMSFLGHPDVLDEHVDRVRCAGNRHRDRLDLALRGDSAPLRRGIGDGDPRRGGRLDYWRARAQCLLHVRCRPVSESTSRSTRRWAVWLKWSWARSSERGCTRNRARSHEWGRRKAGSPANSPRSHTRGREDGGLSLPAMACRRGLLLPAFYNEPVCRRPFDHTRRSIWDFIWERRARTGSTPSSPPIRRWKCMTLLRLVRSPPRRPAFG